MPANRGCECRHAIIMESNLISFPDLLMMMMVMIIALAATAAELQTAMPATRSLLRRLLELRSLRAAAA